MSNEKQKEYTTAGEGLKHLKQDFNDWCSILTIYSIQASYAIIAANWAVHSNASTIIQNNYAKWSLITVFVFLGVNIIVSGIMIHMLDNRYEHGEKNSKQWKTYFVDYKKGNNDAWPYTNEIEKLGEYLRYFKIGAPILAATLFILSLF